MRIRQAIKTIAGLKVIDGKWFTRTRKNHLKLAWHTFYVRMRRRKRRLEREADES
jgi:hypothetical protein